jgi:transcriptional regulator with XRE-family HTH domain
MKRRQFLILAGIISLGLIATTRVKAASLISTLAKAGNEFKEKILEIIKQLKAEGSNLVKKIMNGKKYEYDPYTHYPYDGGIKDEKTGYQLFFHIHRPNEYGHFHTFAIDEKGELVHLILISMDEQGKPIALATVNRWVTGDKYVKADVLKKLTKDYDVDPSLFSDQKVVEFINNIFKAYTEEIYQLYDERDKWITDYVNTNFREPFEDREFEILSERKIDLFSS